MISLSVKYDDRIVFYDHISYLDMTQLPYVFFEVNGVPDIVSVVLDNSVLSFSLEYERTFDILEFKEDRENLGTFEVVELFNPQDDLESEWGG